MASIDVIEPKSIAEISTICRVTVAPSQPKLMDNYLPIFKVSAKEIKESPFDKELPKNKAVITAIIAQIRELSKLNHPLFKDQLDLLSYKIENRDPSELADLVASLTTASGMKLQQVLQELNVAERLKKVNALLTAEIEVCKLVVELTKSKYVLEANIRERILLDLVAAIAATKIKQNPLRTFDSTNHSVANHRHQGEEQ